MLPNSQPPEFATKTDLHALRLELKADMADLKVAIAELKADLTWRMVLMTGGFIAIIGALRILT